MSEKPQFIHGQSARTVLGKSKNKKQLINKLKETLGFQAKSEYYLKLNDRKYLNMVLYVLCAKSTLTQGFKKVFQSLEEGHQCELRDQYLLKNDKRTTFNAPFELKKMSSSLNYESTIFEQCHHKFEFKLISHYVSRIKQQFKVVMKYAGSKEEDFGDGLAGKSEETILLIEDVNNKSIVIAAFSANDWKEEEMEKEEKGEKEEEAKKEERTSLIDLPEQSSPKNSIIKKEQSFEPSSSKKNKTKGKKAESSSKKQQKAEVDQKVDAQLTDSVPIWQRGQTWTVLLSILVLIVLAVGLKGSLVQGIADRMFDRNHVPLIERIIKGVDYSLGYFS